jgi:hypothetical protein
MPIVVLKLVHVLACMLNINEVEETEFYTVNLNFSLCLVGHY